jgi:PleD family two-component response regulator
MKTSDLSLNYVCTICGAQPQERCEMNSGTLRFESHREAKASSKSQMSVNQATILQKEERFMATLNTPVSELRPATMDRIVVIEHDGALRRILQRLFSSEGYEVDVVPGAVAGLEMLRQRPPSVVVLDLPYAESSPCDL